jgi:hypothetical protein
VLQAGELGRDLPTADEEVTSHVSTWLVLQPLNLAAFAARGAPPPAFEGATTRALLRCIIPPPLTKVRSAPRRT